MFRFVACAALVALAAGSAAASGPVRKTYEGCVVNGAYVVGPYVIRLFDRAQRPVDVSRYEGQRLRLTGDLLPSDRFYILEGPVPLGRCR